MEIKRIQDENLEGKSIIMRVDFNVSIEDGKVQDRYKIESCAETVKYILSQKNTKLALISHLGRPQDSKMDMDDGFLKKFSFRQIVSEIEEIIGVKVVFIPGYGKDLIKKELGEVGENGGVLLLENVRFFSEEEENDESFSRELASNFDIYVNEAFSNSHRAHSSMVGLPEVLPGYAGFQFQKELNNLDKIKFHPEHPAVAIIGGAKIKTKLPLIESFSNNYEYVLVGGMVANEAIDTMIDFSDRVVLPFDFAKNRLDIGPQTISRFKDIINQAETIVWNGPLGKFEESPYDVGTREIVDAIMSSEAFTVAGGGESIQVLERLGVMDKFSFISTGGGAMLKYLSGEDMPGLNKLLK
ncbi:phosphoglycerate kinase [Patescibacteria group bacterium]